MIASEHIRAIAAAELPDQTKVVLMVLWSHVHQHDTVPVVWPSIAALAESVGCDRRAAARHIARLRDAGWLARESAMHIQRGDRRVFVEHPLVLVRPSDRASTGVVTEGASGVVTEESGGSDRTSIRNSLTNPPIVNPQNELPPSEPIRPKQSEIEQQILIGDPDPTRAAKLDRRTSKRVKSREDAPSDLAAFLFAEINLAREHIHKRPMRLREPTPGMLKAFGYLWAQERPTFDDITHCVSVRAALDSRGDKFGQCDWAHMCRPGSFQRYRDMEVPEYGPGCGTDDDEAPPAANDGGA